MPVFTDGVFSDVAAAAAASGGDEVVTTVTLGAATDTQTFTVDGDGGDEIMELFMYGECEAGATVTIEFNATTLSHKTVLAQGALTQTASFAAATSLNENLTLYCLFYLKTNGADRVACYHGGLGNGGATVEHYSGMAAYNNTATNVTSITLKGSAANTFGVDFRFILRRKKLS